MNTRETMKLLEESGAPNHRKTYARHGVTADTFGVPYAKLYAIQKKIGVDQDLANDLWATGNHDACVLACFVADPAGMKASTLDAWAKTANNQLILDAVAGLTARTAKPTARMTKWMTSKQEWVAAAGWHLLSFLAMQPECPLTDAQLEGYLALIEEQIDGAENRVKHEMNGALIAISTRSTELRAKATEAAKRIGKVEVDHGNTACKTPDAVKYIAKAAARKTKKKASKTTTSKKKAAKKKATK